MNGMNGSVSLGFLASLRKSWSDWDVGMIRENLYHIEPPFSLPGGTG
jgi:hypothetical protein